MSGLASLFLQPAYHKPTDDIARAFYLPSLAASVRYDRAVGYFSSAIYIIAWPSLRKFVERGGKMRLICSPMLSSNDIDALQEGYSARAEASEGDHIRQELQRLLVTPGLIKPAKVLSALIALDVIDCRIAWVGLGASGRPKRLFHDKVGIFVDEYGNSIVFKGSMNETWPGLSADGNLESVDVFPSWINERDRQRVEDERLYFDHLFENRYEGVTTKPISEIARNSLIESADVEHWPELVDEICIEIEEAVERSPEKQRASRRTLRPHQLAALKNWETRGRRGIFKHATGSGKTFTALCAIEGALERGEIPLILVPSELLLHQWSEEIRSSVDGVRLLRCGAGHVAWRSADLLRAWTRPIGPARRVILATMQTARGDEFVSQLRAGAHILFVADEVHRLGAAKLRRLFEIASGPRLGLSATPERSGDDSGTAAIFDYFNGIVPPPFTLADAIAAGALTPYVYHVHHVSLDEAEQEAWNELTSSVRQLYAQFLADRTNKAAVDRLHRKLIERARIVKGAHAKVGLAVKVVQTHYQLGQRWIVYCDDQRQLEKVFLHLRAAGIQDVYEYHSAMEGGRKATLDLFEARGGVVVSIRCLDEGIDIPSVTHALILASSRNPREYVQRRGRVLRRAEGKTIAHIHDALVTPKFDPSEPAGVAILEGELVRAIEFGRNAINPSCVTDLERLAIQHDIDLDVVRSVGLEDDDEEGS